MRADRLKLLGVMGMFALPALAAWVAHEVWQPLRTASYGELLPPTPPPLIGLTDLAGQPADLSGLRGRWVLLTVTRGACGSACRQQLDLARRVRLAQGRDQGRVAQALIQTFAITPVEAPDLRTYRLPDDALAAWPGPAGTYLVDPRGRLMLRFPAAPEGAGMLRDVRRLLLASRIG